MSELAPVCDAVKSWLHGEHSYQFDKFDAIYGKELVARRNFIALHEIPDKWHRNTLFRKSEAIAQANQQVLKICAATRAVVIYDACIEGQSRDTASKKTFEELSALYESLRLGSLPEASILGEEFDIAFPDSSPHPSFIRASLLAVTAVNAVREERGVIELPNPGLPSGQLS